MGYIKDENHLTNFINKTLSLNPGVINYEEMLDRETYIDLIYCKNLADKFTWDLKHDPQLLEHEKVIEWLRKNNSIGYLTIPSNLEHIITAEFSGELKKLRGLSGVYSFWNKTQPLYIGVSIDISSRAVASFGEKFDKYKRPVYFRYITTKTTTDAAVLEVYFIGKLKPALNGTAKYKDGLTLKIDPEYEFSNPILCNRIKNGKNKT